MTDIIQVRHVAKTFVLHNQGAVTLPIFADVSFGAGPGDCVLLNGPSGTGKSTLLRMLHGNYKCTRGEIFIRHKDRMIDIVTADARRILEIRRHTMSYVSQFLRVIPRISALDIVKEPLLARGIAASVADQKAKAMLERLNVPEALWRLAPATFSGGEQQRINIARSFIAVTPLMLLDEPTASLDAANRDVVISLIEETRAAGSAIIGIFHDESLRARISMRRIDIQAYKAAEAA